MNWSLEGLDGAGAGTGVTDAPSWLGACAATQSGRTVVLRHGRVALPLCLIRSHGLVIAQCLGQTSRSFAGPLGDGAQAMPPLDPEDLPGSVDLLDFRRFPEPHCDSVLPSLPFRLVRPDILHFGRPLEASEEAFLATLSKGTRKDLRYALHRVRKVFGKDNVRCETVRLTAENWAETSRRAAAFARYTWQGQANVSVLMNPQKQAFLSQLMRNALTVKMHFQHLGDAVAALAVTMEHDDTVLIYAHEYHMGYSKYQPGHILNANIIAEAIANGLTRLDFGVGATSHKYEWKCEPRALWRIMAPLTWKGWVAVAVQQLRWRLGALRKPAEEA